MCSRRANALVGYLLLVTLHPSLALQCYSNLDQSAWDALDWLTRSDAFLASEYPTLNESVVVEVNGSEFSCLTGQAYPRGYEMLSTCLFNAIGKDIDVEDLVLANMIAVTCDTDLCNDNCNDAGSWWKGRQVNIALILILVAFGFVGVGLVVAAIANMFDQTRKKKQAGAAIEGSATAAATEPQPVGVVVVDAAAASSTQGAAQDEAAQEAKAQRNGKKAAEPQATFAQVLSVASPTEYALFVCGCLAAVTTGMGTPLMSLLFGRSIGGLADADVLDTMTPLVLQLVYIALGSTVSASFMYALLENVGGRVAQRWSEAYLTAVMRQDVGWFDVGAQSGSLLATMTEETRAVGKGVGIQVGLFLMHVVEGVAGLTIAFTWAGYWDVALVCLAGVPIIMVASAVMLATNEKLGLRETAAYAAAGALAGEAIGSMRTVQALNAQPSILARFEAALVPAERASLIKCVGSGSALGILNGAFMVIYLFASLYVGQKLVDAYYATNCNLHGFEEVVESLGGNVTEEGFPQCDDNVGDILATLFNVVFGGMQMGQLADPLAKMGAAKTAVRKIMATVARVPPIDLASDAGAKPEDLQGDLSFADVTFAYPARAETLVNNRLSLTVSAGQTVALVGPSGSGKSTVMALVQRFYDPLSGTVSLDGHDLKSLNVRHLRSKIGLVGQEPVLFAGSVKQNIAYGAIGNTADDEAIKEAAKLSNAHGFIRKLEKGYDTDVGAGGGKISGGQKQRVAIARAIIRNPVLLLLDEATSALDNESERIVQAALNELLQKQRRTTLVIAHRLSTIRGADKIVVMQAGAVAEEGTHDELVGKDGLYKELLDAQGGARQTSMEMTEAALEKAAEASQSSALHRQTTKGSLDKSDGGAAEGLSLREKAKLQQAEDKRIAKAAKKVKSRIWAMQRPDILYLLCGGFGAVANGLVFPVMAVTFAGMIFMLLSVSPAYISEQKNSISTMFAMIAVLLCVPSALIQFYGFGVAGERLTTRIRLQVFEKMLRTEVSFFDLPENGAGSLVASISEAAANVKALTGEELGRNMTVLCCLAFGPFLAMYFSWHMVLAVFAIMPFLGAGNAVFLAIMQGGFGPSADDSKAALNVMTEALNSVRTVASLQVEGVLMKQFRAAGASKLASSITPNLLYGLVFAAGLGLQFLSWATLFYIAAKLLDEGIINIRDMLFGLFVSVFSTFGIANASQNATDATVAAKAVVSTFEFLEKDLQIDGMDTEDGSKPEGLQGAVEVADVVFAYPSRPHIKIASGFSLSIAAGQTVALVGKSGCGKSTMVLLLERFYDPVSGTVSLDGHDLKSLNVRHLRSKIGLVGQEPVLFAGSVASNIARGMHGAEATRDQVETAAKLSNAHGFISTLSQGYDTEVGARGGQLSGGQKQRVAIARAIISNPVLLLLDEATSALDNESERIVQAALNELLQKQRRTTLVIAHRLSTIRDADQICFIHEGKVAEQGTHQELMDASGHYAAMVEGLAP